MREFFEEYGIFIVAVIVGFVCIQIFLDLFIGETSIIGSLLDTFVGRLM